MKRIDVPGGHISYAEVGAGSPPIVLLHAGYAEHTMWEHELKHLGATKHVVAADARTHGSSSTAMAPFRHCDDIAALVRKLDAGPVVLVGISMGAREAIDTALEHPDLVHALVISGAGAGDPTFTDPWTLERIALLEKAIAMQDAAAWLRQELEFAAGPFRATDDVQPLLDRLRPMHEGFVATHIRPGVQPPVWVEDAANRVAEINVPVLGIVGSLDSLDHQRMCEEAVNSMPNGQGTVRFEGAGHYPNLEQPLAWQQTIDHFLAQQTPKA